MIRSGHLIHHVSIGVRRFDLNRTPRKVERDDDTREPSGADEPEVARRLQEKPRGELLDLGFPLVTLKRTTGAQFLADGSIPILVRCLVCDSLFGHTREDQPLREVCPDALRHEGETCLQFGGCQLGLYFKDFLHCFSGSFQGASFRKAGSQES